MKYFLFRKMRKSAAPSKLGTSFNPPVIGNTNKKSAEAPKSAKESVFCPVESAARSTASILSLLNRPKTEDITVNQNYTEDASPAGRVFSETNDCVVSSTENNSKRMFNVVYGKPSKKKHKTWEGDGILEVGEKSLVLKDTEGIVLGRGSGKKNSELCEGSRLFVGNKEVEIIDLVNPVLVKKRPIDKSSENISPRIGSKVKKKRNTLSTASISLTKSRQGFNVQPLECAPFVLPRPDQEHQWYCNTAGVPVTDVVVDTNLTRILRDHQKEGVVFLYKCVTGICNINYTGAILADEMGLGKTVQCIALIWTLLKQGPYGAIPLIKRVLIVTPSSLTRNWQQEFARWLGSERIRTFVVDNKNKPKDFVNLPNHPVLIISYEMFVRCYEEIKPIQFQLMICDEGHRLKNSIIKAYMLLNQIPCKRRVLLTGTPIQNDLQEFFALIDFVNPGILGTNSEFRKMYETSIVASRQPEAEKHIEQEGEERAQELSRKTNGFILRRTQSVLDQYLPKKYETVIFCRPTPLQIMLYEAIIDYWEKRKETGNADITHLAIITMLKKISNHPILILQQNEDYDDLQEESLTAYLSSVLCEKNIEKPLIEDGSKLAAVTSLLQDLLPTREKIVLVSYFTQTLDLLEAICEQSGYKYCRLDGTTASAQRINIVNNFNSPYSDHFVFILSARAGGVGLNLTGASRLVLFDSDWNPATDLQAMARVWRDGQKKSVHIYRFLTTGSIEEKIFQRQLSKAGLNEAVVDPENISAVRLADDELKDLFRLNTSVDSTTHETLQCTCNGEGDIPRPQELTSCPDTEDRDCQLTVGNKNSAPSVLRMNQLFQWQHHTHPVDSDLLLKLQLQGASDFITFVFHNVSQ